MTANVEAENRISGAIVCLAAVMTAVFLLMTPSGKCISSENETLTDIGGWVVFDSKRNGQFDIYKMRPDGSEITQLTDTPEWETNPDWSPDGSKIVFARKQPGDDDVLSSIYIMDSNGGDERKIIKKGSSPRFTADGKAVVYDRDRVKILSYEIDTWKRKKLAPPKGSHPFKYHMIKPQLSPDGKVVLFISDKGGKWNSWAMTLDGETKSIGSGCQPTWHPDGKRIFFIRDTNYQENAIWSFDWPDGSAKEYLALSGTYCHVYFPSVSDDGKYLLFSACPDSQHDHSAANYQIFIKKIDGGEPIRISRNKYTERWPRLSTTAH